MLETVRYASMRIDLISVEPLARAASSVPDDDVAPVGVALLKLLANRTRRRVFLALMRGETCNCELAADLDLAENLISHHVRRLRQAGLVRERRHERDARWVYYSLDRDALGAAWRALSLALDPALIGERTPDCGPAALEARREAPGPDQKCCP